VAETDEAALEEQWPNFEKMFGRIGRERGWAPPTKEGFVQEVKYGSQYVGSPETVAKKIVHAVTSIGAKRFDFKYANGPQSHTKLMKSLELYGTKVIPLVKEMLKIK
jgi:alkanesulfonate monooxygenase SsuD/methylene tetrahydromethanopterin reductase-like flavin-dependent oxidoreductase (luciferase family)